MGPFFWGFSYVLVCGIALFVLGAKLTPIRPLKRSLRRGVLLEEIAFVLASFLVFYAFLGT